MVNNFWRYTLLFTGIQFFIMVVAGLFFKTTTAPIFDSYPNTTVIVFSMLITLTTMFIIISFFKNKKVNSGIWRYKNLEGSLRDDELVAAHGYNEDREIIFWNKGCENIFGLKEEEVLGYRIENITVPENRREEAIRVISNWIESGHPKKYLELELKDIKNAPIYFLTRFQEFRDTPEGKRFYFIGNDIRKQKKELETLWVEHRQRFENLN